ncbi:hypothetical protein JNB11_01530 [Kocuria palustris]|nr:hypothetical protein [Kocuria palustris]
MTGREDRDRLVGYMHQLHQHIRCLHERVAYLEASLNHFGMTYFEPVLQYPIFPIKPIETYQSLTGTLNSNLGSSCHQNLLLLLLATSVDTTNCDLSPPVEPGGNLLKADSMGSSNTNSAKSPKLPADDDVEIDTTTLFGRHEPEVGNSTASSNPCPKTMKKNALPSTPPLSLNHDCDVDNSLSQSALYLSALDRAILPEFSIPPLATTSTITNDEVAPKDVLIRSPAGTPPLLPTLEPLTPVFSKSKLGRRRRVGVKVSPKKQLPPLPKTTEPSPVLSRSGLRLGNLGDDDGHSIDTRAALTMTAKQLEFTPGVDFTNWHRDVINCRNDLIRSSNCHPETVTELLSIIFCPGLLLFSAECDMGLHLLRICQEASASTPPRTLNAQELTDIFAYVIRVAKRILRRWARRREERV